MEEQKYKSYLRIHNFENPQEEERAKIKRETRNFKKYNKKMKQSAKRLASNYSDADYEEYEEYLHISERQRKTAKGHKERLKHLKTNKII